MSHVVKISSSHDSIYEDDSFLGYSVSLHGAISLEAAIFRKFRHYRTDGPFPCSYDSPSGYILSIDAKPYFAISFLILSYNKSLGFPRGFFV
jgi:hypothetical protein